MILAALLDLSALLAEAEANAPAIRAAQYRVAAAAERAPQAQALPDPLLSLTYENESLDRITWGESMDTGATVTWTQEFPGGGKRDAREQFALAERRVAVESSAAILATVRARVFTAYVELHRIDRTRAIVEGSRPLLEAARDAARVRFENGEGTLADVLKAGTALSRLEIDLAALDGERGRAEASLGAVLGRTGPARFAPALDPPVELPWDPTAAEAAALENAPELRRLASESARESSRIDAARLEMKPDWMASGAYTERGPLESMVMGMVGVRLPLWRDRKQARAVAEAERERDAIDADVDAARAALVAEVRDVAARIDEAARRTSLLEQAIVPQRRAAFDAALAAYRNGRADFASVLDEVEGLYTESIEIETQRGARWSALAALEPLTGRAWLGPGVSR
ncbi:MAG TPA: TolC family protein [Candidatus Polarisedimenticolaceae bacterium]